MDEQLLAVTGRGLGGGAGLEASLATLHEAETRVRGVVARRFAEAVREEDLASIERFFKIFPLLGMHDEGISSFTGYLCSKLVESSRRNLKAALDTPASSARAQVILADTLTLLFEGVARVVEIHQPLIETYYGPGRLPAVLARIQVDLFYFPYLFVLSGGLRRAGRPGVPGVPEAARDRGQGGAGGGGGRGQSDGQGGGAGARRDGPAPGQGRHVRQVREEALRPGHRDERGGGGGEGEEDGGGGGHAGGLGARPGRAGEPRRVHRPGTGSTGFV